MCVCFFSAPYWLPQTCRTKALLVLTADIKLKETLTYSISISAFSMIIYPNWMNQATFPYILEISKCFQGSIIP